MFKQLENANDHVSGHPAVNVFVVQTVSEFKLNLSTMNGNHSKLQTHAVSAHVYFTVSITSAKSWDFFRKIPKNPGVKRDGQTERNGKVYVPSIKSFKIKSSTSGSRSLVF